MSPLRTRRVERQLSLRELAYFAGCSHTTISRLERGDIDVSPALKARIARALRVPAAELFAPETTERESVDPIDKRRRASHGTVSEALAIRELERTLSEMGGS